MARAAALRLLALPTDAPRTRIEEALRERLAAARSRLESAPTEALREKFAAAVAELEAAARTLLDSDTSGVPTSLSRTMAEDLPAVAPSFTMGDADDGGAAGSRISIEQGQILAGRYEIRERIGAGGMGAVFRAFDRNRQGEIAIKVMLPSLIGRGKAKERFLAEAKLSSELSHPGIVNVFDVQNEGELYFLTMELLEGRTLREEMDECAERGQMFPVERAIDIGRQVALALSYAHKKTIHRDIKPENIFLTSDGEAKLLDFGIARALTQPHLTQHGSALGSVYYASPEQVGGAVDIDGRSDLYSLGVVLYELLVGSVPIGIVQPVGNERRDVPTDVSSAVMRCLSASPALRIPDAGTLAELLSVPASKRAKQKVVRSVAQRAVAGGECYLPSVKEWRRLGIGVVLYTIFWVTVYYVPFEIALIPDLVSSGHLLREMGVFAIVSALLLVALRVRTTGARPILLLSTVVIASWILLVGAWWISSNAVWELVAEALDLPTDMEQVAGAGAPTGHVSAFVTQDLARLFYALGDRLSTSTGLGVDYSCGLIRAAASPGSLALAAFGLGGRRWIIVGVLVMAIDAVLEFTI